MIIIVMSEQQNETLAHRFHMDVFQKGDMNVADEILAKDFVLRNPAIPPELRHSPDGVKKIASSVIESVPDRTITHDDTISKGDRVLIRWTMTGTLKKELFGMPATDKGITLIGFDLFRISDGRILELWQQFSVGNWV
jgi:steroid delta-isomerase-like uncharacterized protein